MRIKGKEVKGEVIDEKLNPIVPIFYDAREGMWAEVPEKYLHSCTYRLIDDRTLKAYQLEMVPKLKQLAAVEKELEDMDIALSSKIRAMAQPPWMKL